MSDECEEHDHDHDDEDLGHIKAKFYLSSHRALIIADYKNVTLTLRWGRDEPDEVMTKRLRLIISNLPDVMADCFQEAIIQSQARELTSELENLLNEGEDE